VVLDGLGCGFEADDYQQEEVIREAEAELDGPTCAKIQRLLRKEEEAGMVDEKPASTVGYHEKKKEAIDNGYGEAGLVKPVRRKRRP
jgi:hypothetical protein